MSVSHLKPYVGPDGVNYGTRTIYWIISTLLIVSMWQIFPYLLQLDIQKYGPTEFLINYEGGFVRRGLLGQILFWICRTTGWSPAIMIQVISASAYCFVVCFFLKKFIAQGYSWWFIFSPLFLGFVVYVVRKDFIEYSVLIGVLCLLKKDTPSLANRILATLLMILGLFLHEAFMFWGFPIFALIMIGTIKKCKYGWLNVTFLISVFLIFILQIINKGDSVVAHTVVNSWNGLYDNSLLVYTDRNSIGALSWETIDTFLFHLRKNFNGVEGVAKGFIWQPLYMMMIYYFCTNFIFVLKKDSLTNIRERKLVFSSVYLMTLICLLPMFLVLSCDYGRLYQYITVVSCATLVIIPYQSLTKFFPTKFLDLIKWINSKIAWLLTPNKHLMIILLMVLAMGPAWFSLSDNINYSVIGKFAEFTGLVIRKIGFYLLII